MRIAMWWWVGCVPLDEKPEPEVPDSEPTAPTPGTSTGPTSGTTPGTPTSGTTPETPTVTLGAWEPCDRLVGSGDAAAECAMATVPRDWDDPEGPTYDLLVKRVPAVDPAAHLWVVHGGPGGSAVDELDLLSYGIPELRPDIEVYAVDHRGIGGSGRLGCPAEDADSLFGAAVAEAEWPSCLESLVAERGEELDFITTTASARDLGALIGTLGADRQTFVWGGSYGTYAVLRYLHLFPDQPAGVILEGIQHPARDFVGYDADIDRVSHDLFDVCAQDPDCAEHFAGDPWQTAQAAVASLDAGHCPELGLDSDGARGIFGSLVFYWQTRDVLPAVVHRLERCAPDDIEVLQHLLASLGLLFGATLSGNDGLGSSDLLFYHVALSEMWYPPDEAPAVDTLLADWQTMTMSTGLEIALGQRSGTWPRYPADSFDDAVPAYAGPLLMLQGGLDAPTPWEQAWALTAEYDGPAQTWALFPYGAHGVVGGSPAPGGDCALDVYLQFLAQPATPPDLSCIDDIAPPEFDGDPALTTWLLGTADAWGDGGAAAVAPQRPRIAVR
jgi:pimeloyl-ACP methyl ester carboxylesterase